MRSLTTTTILLLLATVLPASAVAQTKIEPAKIAPTKALEHVGRNVQVRLVVSSIGRSGEWHNLNSGKSWDAPGNLVIRLSPDVREELARRGFKNPGLDLLKKQIDVTGTVLEFRPGGKLVPGIELKSANDLKVVDDSAETPLPRTANARSGSPVEIKPEEGLQFIGRTVRVRLTPQAMGRAGELHLIHSGKSWDAPGNFQVRFGPDMLAAFAKDGIEDPGLHLLRKHIEVTGTVAESLPGGKRVPGIDLESLDDLTYVLQSTREAPSISELLSRRADVHLRNRKRFGNVVVAAIEAGSRPESLVSLKLKIGDDPPRLYRASAIEEVIVDGVPLDLSFDRKDRVLFVDKEKRTARLKADEEAERRVLSIGRRLWPRLTDEEHAEWVAQHKEFIATIQKHFSQLPLKLIETKYHLILTDIPDSEAQKYLAYLDTLYDEMCRAFGIPLGSNIWSGKCIVCAFQNRADFIRFELEVMKNTNGNPTNSGGICHGTGQGRIVISLFKGTFEARFATVLVHETSHGFVNRFRSDVTIPSWLNEGMAVWIAKYIVKEDDSLEKAQRKSIIALRDQQTLAGFFDGSQIPGERYGTASAMVDILVNRDSEKFRQFFIDIKLGYPAEEALQRAFNMSFAELTSLYGKSIGMPNLRH
ncbi:MAG: hypothetical protein HQ518_06590 [Rhodopirellula sp.]|nr:hypothetical protein [Rhodopirellula sp.]